ncbi:MAG TPA: hypothetical protein PKE00_00495, partial [Planctomycetota bacterium]|nr:hypothetical protein [Planctomycetota bacterium]
MRTPHTLRACQGFVLGIEAAPCASAYSRPARTAAACASLHCIGVARGLHAASHHREWQGVVPWRGLEREEGEVAVGAVLQRP